ncbi:MAG: ATP-dependent DNA helicase [Pseudomonadota bacterium]
MNHHKRIDGILGPSGLLARSMSGYEHREQQVRMAVEVFEALQSGDRLVIEAPTGTGKTLAYLIAASLTRKKTAISTGTKNLQEQLFFKDVPFVMKHVFPALKVALLKGRGNFVCRARFLRYVAQPGLAGIGDTGTLREIVKWYKLTGQSGEGDRAELENLPDDDPIWPEICSTTETCAGKKCPHKDECFVSKMRARAGDADLMIVNHHLLASDLSVKESGYGEVIPRYEALILDEAHGFEDAATQHFGFHLSHFRIARLVRDTRQQVREAGLDALKFHTALTGAEDHGRRLFSQFNDIAGLRERIGSIEPSVAESRDALHKTLESLASMLSNVPDASEELRLLARRANDISLELKTILCDDSDGRHGEYACWAERREHTVILHASPVEVGDKLRQLLYEKVPAIVFTSATLSSGGNFNYFKSRLGLEKDLEPSETILDSPFDYSRQTMLYIPRSLPEPNAPGFTDSLVPVLEQVLVRTRGRAFVLFTSYRNMETVFRKMEGRVPFPLLIQGSKPKGRLLDEFRRRSGSVLFATSSFWEGVDVQGEALSCVMVDRLPFAPPNDPIVSARLEKLRREGKEHFYSFQVPMAVIALKQGLGRLIRTRSDRGILCILDLRILTKSYGKVFRESLHGSPLRRDPQDIESFFSTSPDSAGPAAKNRE